MQINVTQENIDQGEPQNGVSCPIARALEELGYTDFHVGTDEIMFTLDTDTRYVSLPARAQEFIERFDDRYAEGCEPFSFQIVNPVRSRMRSSF